MAEHYIIDFGVNFANTKRYPSTKLDVIMEESWNGGVEKMVCISNSMEEARIISDLSKKYDCMYYTLGVHPHNASQFTPKDLTA